jgi:hypothetical protein
MSRKKSEKNSPPLSLPPELGSIDLSWDELDGGDGDDPFSRTTAVPDVPSETYAKRVMAEAERAEPDLEPPAPPAAADDAPPPARAREDRRSASTVPPPARGKGTRRQRAVTRRDQPATRQKRATSRPKGARSQQPALELASSSEPSPSHLASGGDADRARVELKDRYAIGDFSGALAVAESILERVPGDLEAERYAQSCREVLLQMYSERVGSLRTVARVAIPSDQIRWLSLDHRAGFLLSLIDGTSTLEEILDISGMPRLDALRIVHALLEQRVISVGDRR